MEMGVLVIARWRKDGYVSSLTMAVLTALNSSQNPR